MTEPPINIHIHSTLSRRQRAQLARAFKKGEQVAIIPAKPKPATPGYRTTEFWVSVLTTIGTVAAAANGSLPDRYAVYAAMTATIAYALSRGLAKH